MKNWGKVKTTITAGSFVTGLQGINREKKLSILHQKDYSTRDSLLKWLELAEPIIKENQTTIRDLLTKKASYLNLINQLHSQKNDTLSEEEQKNTRGKNCSSPMTSWSTNERSR